MPARVSINISLPSYAFKRKVKRIAKLRKKNPSKEFVELYHQLAEVIDDNPYSPSPIGI